MMGLWWLQPGWADARCGTCGEKIAPEGDPDWGLCWPCMQHSTELAEQERAEQERYENEMREMEEHYRRHPHG